MTVLFCYLGRGKPGCFAFVYDGIEVRDYYSCRDLLIDRFYFSYKEV